LKLRRRGKEMRKQHIWLAYKRHSKGKDWPTPYGERYRNIAAHGEYL